MSNKKKEMNVIPTASSFIINLNNMRQRYSKNVNLPKKAATKKEKKEFLENGKKMERRKSLIDKGIFQFSIFSKKSCPFMYVCSDIYILLLWKIGKYIYKIIYKYIYNLLIYIAFSIFSIFLLNLENWKTGMPP